MREYKSKINSAFELLFDDRMRKSQDVYIYELLKKYILSGGKRLRPIALLMAYEGVGGQKEMIVPSLSVELFHNSTLVHDDIMDEEDERRGVKSLHESLKDFYLNSYEDNDYKGRIFSKNSSRFGVSSAILAGNILYSMGAQALFRADVESRLKRRALDIYNDAYRIVNEGQLRDTTLEIRSKATEKDYISMVESKTANLFKDAVLIGAVLGNANQGQLNSLSRFSLKIATAFQMQDDIMDISLHLSKGHELGSDLKQGKRTLIFIKAMQLGSENEKRAILESFGKKDATSEEIKKAIDAIHASGSVEYVEILAQKLIDAGKKELEKADLSVKSKQLFKEFSDFLIEREA